MASDFFEKTKENFINIREENKTKDKEDLVNYAKNDEELIKLNEFYDITKGLVKFSKVKEVKELLAKVEQI